MDEIDGMNNGDKGGLNSLIKLIRGKKTKKQKSELSTMIPIVCIGNTKNDKKMKELMKVCFTIELKPPTKKQIVDIIQMTMHGLAKDTYDKITQYINFDLHKLQMCISLHKQNQNTFVKRIVNSLVCDKVKTECTKDTTKYLLNNRVQMDYHSHHINEADSTSISLLMHENIIDTFNNMPKCKSPKNIRRLYYDVLKGQSDADYIDRLTFQNQIWILREINSMLKIVETNTKLHSFVSEIDNSTKSNKSQKQNSKMLFNKDEVRFTKVLTKYSTEYNNLTFIGNLCQTLNIDREDLYAFFHNLKLKHSNMNEIYTILDNFEIKKLDVDRMYRFLGYVDE